MAPSETRQGSDSLREAAPAYDDLEARRARAGVAAALFGALSDSGAGSDADAEVDAPDEQPCVGRYRIDARLGSGGMGVVYRAHDPDLERAVAVKLLHSEAGADDKARARMLREARSLAKLSHPNVITVYDVGTQDGQVFVAMELVKGLDLRRWLAQHEGADWREVLALFIAAGRGLEAAHAADLIHRDFKPENVLVGEDERVRVLDFGLARVGAPVAGATLDEPRSTPAGAGLGTTSPPPGEPTEPDADAEVEAEGSTELGRIPTAAWGARLTETGALVGTPLYMAPELYAGAPADARSDQFAFCASLYEGLYRQLPFGARDLRAHVRAVTRGAVVEAPAGSSVPARVHELVTRGLAPEPEGRHVDMSSLLAQLELAAKVPPPTELPEGGGGGRLVLAALAVLALVAGLVFAELREGDAQAQPDAQPSSRVEARVGAGAGALVDAAPRPSAEPPEPVSAGSETGGGQGESSTEETGEATTGPEPPDPEVPSAADPQLHDWCHLHEDRYTILTRSKGRKASFMHEGVCYTCRVERRRSRTRNFQPRDCAGYALCGEAGAEACD